MSYGDIVPHASVFIDATWIEYLQAASWCIKSPFNHKDLLAEIEQLFKSFSNPNPVIPCLSVRSGLDLFLSVHPFLPGSEVIMSAINIPAMVEIIYYHGLEVVSLDVDIKTMKPKIELLESLITSKSRVLLLANIYGRGYDVGPFTKIAKKHGLIVIEDWAEGFAGLDYLGHPESDLSLFSFGPIKYYTAFGGAIAKVKDVNVYHRMKNLYNEWPVLSRYDYLTKVMKYSLVYMVLNCPRIVKQVIFFSGKLGIDHKKKVVNLLRGFPNQMMKKIRQRPCDALLATLRSRLSKFSYHDFILSNVKAEYALANLPPHVMPVGMEATIRNHWLFPILVKNPNEVIEALNKLGVDAYCGATQLNIVESDRPSRVPPPSSAKCAYNTPATVGDTEARNISDARHHCHDVDTSKLQGIPTDLNLNCDIHCDYTSLLTNLSSNVSEAEFLMSHVIYLPINKIVPFQEIDKICAALASALGLRDVESKAASIDQCKFLEDEFSLEILTRNKIRSKL